jgi:hypothetical protein
MKIWLQYEGETLERLKAIAGGVKGAAYFDGTIVQDESLGSIVSQLDGQGLHPIVRVPAALAMKKLHGGLAITYGISRIKSKPDARTLYIELDGTKREEDEAVEEILKFFKTHKVPSTL